MIASFADKATEDLFHGRVSAATRRVPVEVRARAVRKLDALQAARALNDLASPPGNRLEALAGSLAGYYSIRVNQQWRIVFRWLDGAAHDVRFADYH